MSTGSRILISLLAGLCSLVLSEGTNPGIQGRITSKGLDYACQEALAVLRQKLVELHLPDFSGSYKVKVIGNVDYKLDSLMIRNFQLPSSSITPIPDVGLRVTITDALAELSGDWQVKKRWFKDHGSFNLDTEGVFITAGLKLGSDASGRLTATTLDCRAEISNVRVRFSGALSWLYNLFHRNIEPIFRRTLESKICEEVSSSVSSKLLPFLQSMPVTAKIDDTFGIDYALVGPPVATVNFLDLKLKGEFISFIHRSSAPIPSPVLAFPADHDRMLYFGVSSYFFNTAGRVYYSAGSLNFEITDNMIPSEIKIRLHTTSFGAFVPQVEKLYPNVPMKLHVSPASAPALSITPEVLSLSPLVDIEAFAVLSNASMAPLFVIGASTTISAKVAVNSTKIFGSLSLSRLQLSLKHSEVGPFSVQLLQTLLNFSVKNILMRQVNGRLAEGFPLPLPDDVQLSNPILQPHQDFLLFGSDVRYG